MKQTIAQIILSFQRKNLIKLLIPLIFFINFSIALSSSKENKGNLTAQSIHVEAGWNMMSLPVFVTGGIKSSIFPTAVSFAFIYLDSYLIKDTLQNGQGFWLKFDSSATLFVTGDTMFYDTIDVQTGWNIVGSLTIPIAVNAIQTEPPGLIDSEFYSFVPGFGYRATDTLRPGFGYWVKLR